MLWLRTIGAAASMATLLASASLAGADQVTDAEETILNLQKSGKLSDKTQYPAVRTAFAKLFAAKHADVIRQAYGEDAPALNAWLDAHKDLKETLYTALDDRFDKLPAALGLFRSIWKKFPDELEKHPQLGIAVAITWDDPRGVYDFRQHQRRTKSSLPDGQMDGLGNFQYYVENEKVMEGRCRHLPWEFLVFVVDHSTPLEERKWAQKYFLNHRTSKSWHQDVPYDHDMLKAERAKEGTSLHPKLQDEAYSLSNIKKFGGVCAMQADFAARVAKSVGFPAAYCWGASAYRGSHAWWIFVQIQKASPEQLRFGLNSDGRFVGFIKDAFYTGNVTDPHTGQKLLDRDLERQLSLAGRDRAGKRHVELLMRAYPWLQEKLGWDARQRVAFLNKSLFICPQSDEPWLELAKLVKDNELEPSQRETLRAHLESVLGNFKNYPDFLAKVYGDLLTAFDPAEQVRLFQHAVALFEKASRPDLSCDARLRITDALAKLKKWQSAADGLVKTINRFPTEGRYVPKMTARMQEVCGQYRGGNERLAKLYLELVPKLSAYYRNDDSAYSKQLYEQALDYFEKNQMTKYAAELKSRAGRK